MADELDDIIIDLTDLLEEGQPPKTEAKPDSFDLAKELLSSDEPKPADDGVKLDVELSTSEEAALAQELMALDQPPVTAPKEPELKADELAALVDSLDSAPDQASAAEPAILDDSQLADLLATAEPTTVPQVATPAADLNFDEALLAAIEETAAPDQPPTEPDAAAAQKAHDDALLAALDTLNAAPQGATNDPDADTETAAPDKQPEDELLALLDETTSAPTNTELASLAPETPEEAEIAALTEADAPQATGTEPALEPSIEDEPTPATADALPQSAELSPEVEALESANEAAGNPAGEPQSAEPAAAASEPATEAEPVLEPAAPEAPAGETLAEIPAQVEPLAASTADVLGMAGAALAAAAVMNDVSEAPAAKANPAPQAAALPHEKDALLDELKAEIPALLAEVVRPLISSLAAEIVREARRKLPEVIEQVIREEIEKLKQLD